MSELLEPAVLHAPLIETQYEHINNIYPSLQKDLNRTRHPNQNQNTPTINRQIIHPRRNRSFTTPRVHFNIQSSPIANHLDLSNSTIHSTAQLASQQNTPDIPSDYLVSTPTYERIRENPVNPPTSTRHLPCWMKQGFTQGETNLVNDPVDNSSDTYLSLPETFSLPSFPAISQTSTTTFLPNFPTNLDDRYREHSVDNISLRLVWNTFVAPLHYFAKTTIVIKYTIGNSTDYNSTR